MPEIHELGADDFCRQCGGRGELTGLDRKETCLGCNGKGHTIHYVKRHWLDHELPSAVCVHEGQVIGHRVRSGRSEECGCPEEDWLMGNLDYQVHYEADGTGHFIADAGEWQHEEFTPPMTFEQLRYRMFYHFLSLPREP